MGLSMCTFVECASTATNIYREKWVFFLFGLALDRIRVAGFTFFFYVVSFFFALFPSSI